ncbi:MAG: TlpA family protein disulfide reductase [Bacteroidales bacterium]|jgi:thiol-disulfide isomerase/thioredoxin/small nuclear ribonucleoprotein (snRNP)-like protein|nr:TlpA family protein disulfide reductase [Bacteroidales bacterium]
MNVHISVNYFLFLFAGILYSGILFAQPTMITGTAPGAEGKQVRITTPGDGLTSVEKLLATLDVDDAGNFSASLKLEKTTDATISINFHAAEIFLEPGEKYTLRIGAMNYDDTSENDPFIQSQNLEIAITTSGSKELNGMIDKFNNLYNTFLLDNFNSLYRDRQKNRTDSLRTILNREFSQFDNPFFINYTTYKLASLEQASLYYNAAQLARKYLIGKPILYENPEYMDFFNNYFSKYITVTSASLHKIDFQPFFKNPDPEKIMLKTLATDTILKNDQLRELVLLKGLMEWYPMSGYDQEDVLQVIKALQNNSIYPDNQVIAANLVKLLTRLKPGSEAPGFTLMNRDEKELSLRSLRGKPVVLCFWTTYCKECLTELDFMVPLHEKYKDKLHFLCVSADKYFTKMILFINLKKDYTWDFASIGDNMETLVNYEVRSYPLFVLIDRAGKIFKYPAGSPGRDLEAEIQQLLKE